MFFWLYYTTAPVDYTKRPLVLWLQGGPGASSTGIGNFLEIGPHDPTMKNRTNAWTEEVNVLFVDNPVGTGFSYVDDPKYLAANISVIASDLLEFMKQFFLKVPEFETVPFYIFAEAYGGKMAVRFAQTVLKARSQNKVKCQLAGIALGDSMISPVESVLSWGPYLYSTSLVDSVGLGKVNTAANAVAAAVKAGHMENATKLWAEAEGVVEKVTNNVNFFNILQFDGGIDSQSTHKFKHEYLKKLYDRHVAQFGHKLDKFMNGPIRDKLKVIPKNVTWGGQSALVFETLSKEFMEPVTKNVEVLLNTSSIQIVVYNGQLDLEVDILGTVQWVGSLQWAGTKSWEAAARKPTLLCSGYTGAFSKNFKNFSFYWILNAGHMVPADASEIGIAMLRQIVGIKNKLRCKSFKKY
ncbi:retinoid-inducible serine carboxypeptidase-like isoform X2 [Oratosquilla oratoria]